MTSTDTEEDAFLATFGIAYGSIVRTAALVTFILWLLASLSCCCCCARKFALSEIHDHDDAQEELSDWPHHPRFTAEEKRRLGRRKKMRLHQYVLYLLRAGWYLVGDLCQAIVHFVFAAIFLFCAFTVLMPSNNFGSIIAAQAVGIVIAATLAGVLLRLMQVLVGMYIVEPWVHCADAGYGRLERLEKRVDAGFRSIDQVKDRLEDGIEKVAGPALHQVEHLREVLLAHRKVTDELLRHLRRPQEVVSDSVEAAQNRMILAAAHATRRDDIHMFGTNAYHL